MSTAIDNDDSNKKMYCGQSRLLCQNYVQTTFEVQDFALNTWKDLKQKQVIDPVFM